MRPHHFSPSLPRLSIVVAALALAAFLLPGGASACGCGDFKGVVVAHGSSLYGVPWRIKAIVLRGSSEAHFEFSVGEAGSGPGLSIPRPIPRPFGFFAETERESNEYPENYLRGLTDGRVTRLVVEMNDGEMLEVEPTRAPRRFQKRFHWLRALRFFYFFFPSTQEPEVVTAFDAEGRVMQRSTSDRGYFY